MDIRKKRFVVSICLASFLVGGGLTFAVMKMTKPCQSAAKNMAMEKTMFMFGIEAGRATIKPIDAKTDQISFYNVRNITFVSHHPKTLAGNISAKNFVNEIWSDNSKVNVAIYGIGAQKGGKIHVFEASNPRYNVATGDFVIDVVSFGDKATSGFKAQKEMKLNNVTLWINGLMVEQRNMSLFLPKLADSRLMNAKRLALGSGDTILTVNGGRVVAEGVKSADGQGMQQSTQVYVGTKQEVERLGGVTFPPYDPATIRMQNEEIALPLRERIDDGVKEAGAGAGGGSTPVGGSWCRGENC